MISNKLQLVVTDLDGTLLNPQRQISNQDLQSLTLLGENKIWRVVATGRTVYSANQVLSDDFPIDYVIFSNGAGIINWKTKEILYSQSLNADEVAIIGHLLINHHIDFMIHEPIPENHKFGYYQTSNENPEFQRRIEIYKQFARPLAFELEEFGNACQVLAIIPPDISVYAWIKNKLPQFSVIRTTSPLNNNSIWVEIFPEHVSKASAAEWLCKRLGCDPTAVLGIGNDYNDLDLLNWTEYSFIMANAPEELKLKFKITESNSNDGFTKAVLSKFEK